MNKFIRLTTIVAVLLIGLVPLRGGVNGVAPAATAALMAQEAPGEVYEVDMTSDEDRKDCTPGPNDDCSLRGAITRANVNTGTDTIKFIIPGNVVHTIRLTRVLPPITSPVIIDGYSQGGAQHNTNSQDKATNAMLMIVLTGDGNNGRRFDGLKLDNGSGGSKVKGLVLQGFAKAIVVYSAGNRITGNFIGTDAEGLTRKPNDIGITIHGTNNTVGGTDPMDRNLISGNSSGVVLESLATDNTIANNLIGTKRNGKEAIPNTSAGVSIQGSFNTVGGTSPDRGNLISGNTHVGSSSAGIWVMSDDRNMIQGNKIGVNIDGGPLPNDIGVKLVSARDTQVGVEGGGPGANVIANSRGPNVLVRGSTATGNNIRANSIYGSTAGLGIDIISDTLKPDGDGVTENDTNDVDLDPNRRQNFPIILGVTSNETATTIRGSLNSEENRTYAIEFFANRDCNSLGNGEGQEYLGTWKGTTQNFNVSFTTDIRLLPKGTRFVTATATDIHASKKSTSEFSKCFPVEPPRPQSGTPQRSSTPTSTSTVIATATSTLMPASTSTQPPAPTATPVVGTTSTSIPTPVGTGIAIPIDTGAPTNTPTAIPKPGMLSSRDNVARKELARVPALANMAGPCLQDVAATNTFYSCAETSYLKGLIGGYLCGSLGEARGASKKPYFGGEANAIRGQLSRAVTLTLTAPPSRHSL